MSSTFSTPVNRSVVISGPRHVSVLDRNVCRPEHGQALVRMYCSGISAGTEMNVYRGSAPFWRSHFDRETMLFDDTHAQYTYPLAYGYAGVGTIEEVGTDVTGLDTGDLVAALVPHQSMATVARENLIPLGDLPDPRLGVFLPNLDTALNGILDAQPKPGDVVVVFGLGVIGLLTVQLLRRVGVGRIIAVGRRQRRREMAQRLGADLTLAPPPNNVAETVRELSGQRGADIVVELSGSPSALESAIRTAGFGGTVVTLSWYPAPVTVDLSAEFHHLRIQIKSSQVGGLGPHLGPLWSLERRRQTAVELLTRLELLPLITHEYPVDRADDAYRVVDRGDDGLLQCILKYDHAR